MANEIQLGIRITGEGSNAKAEIKSTRDELVSLDSAVRSSTQSAKASAFDWDKYAASIKAQNRAMVETSISMRDYGGTSIQVMANVADGTAKSAFATAQARREIIVLGHEVVSGNFSRIPGSFLVLAERMGGLGSMLSPMTLGIVGIGAALVGGIAAWEKWGGGGHQVFKQLVDDMEQSKKSLQDIQKEFADMNKVSLEANIQNLELEKVMLSQRRAQLVGPDGGLKGTLNIFNPLGPKKEYDDLSDKMALIDRQIGLANASMKNLVEGGGKDFQKFMDNTSYMDKQQKKLHDLTEAEKEYTSAWLAASDDTQRAAALQRFQLAEKVINKRDQEKTTAQDNAMTQYQNALADASKSADKFLHDNQIQVLDNQLKLSLVSYADYFNQKRAIEDDYYAKQISRVQEKFAIEQHAADQARARGDKAGALGKDTNVVKLQADLAGLQQQQQNSTQKIEQDASAVNDQLARQILGMQAQVLNATEQYGQAAVATAALQYGDVIKRLQQEGNAGGVDLIQRLINVQVAQAQIKEIETSYSRMLTDIDAEVKRIDIEKNAGMLTEYEARQKLLSLYRQQLDLTDRELSDQQALRAQETTPEAQKASDDTIQKLKLKIAQLEGAVSEINRTFEYGAKSAVDEYFDTITNHAKQAHDVFITTFKAAEDTLAEFFKTGKLNATSFFDAIENSLAHLAAQRFLEPFVGSSDNPGFLSNAVDAVLTKIGLKNAAGGVYAGAGIDAYANSVVTRPTLFPFATGIGLMGEKPGSPGEAIMPLSRMSGGDLGVKVSGGSGSNVNLTVNLIESPGKGGQVQQRQDGNGITLDVVVEKITSMQAREIQRGGGLSPVLQQVYGLNRASSW